jgi:release factor glutamine methyltransferase
VTVLEIIQKSTAFLTGKGVESPRLQSESILAHVLQLPRMQLYLNFQRELSEPEISSCRELVRRRGRREPLQHVLGSTSFCGLEIRVNRHALIPRPETEQLVALAESFLDRLDASAPTVLDLGTGTGCIAIALAAQVPSAVIVASDLSAEALNLARANAAAAGLQNRIPFLQGDGFQSLPTGTCFDLIVSNPPYIPSGEIGSLQPEVRDHDPRLALDGGPDGLAFYRMLASMAPGRLTPAGGLMVEFGDGQAGAINAILAGENWIVEPPVPDYSGRERFLIARPFHPGGARLT